MERLYFADNLQVMRADIHEASVDLIYLDPPFNSKRHYNLLFKGQKGRECDAQITAFEDSWGWGEPAEREYSEILGQANTTISELMRALRSFLGENDLMAYLVMMANRLIEMHRVLKPTGSSAKRYGPSHDVLLFYSKTGEFTWNPTSSPASDDYKDSHYTQVDPDGRYWQAVDLTGAGVRRGETGRVSWIRCHRKSPALGGPSRGA